MEAWIEITGIVTAIITTGTVAYKLGVSSDGKKEKESLISCIDHANELVRIGAELGSLKRSIDELRSRHERFDDGTTEKIEAINKALNQLIGELKSKARG